MTVSNSDVTVSKGQVANLTVTLTPVNGFKMPVNLTCSGMPAGTTCSFSPPTVTPDGAPVSSTLSILVGVSDGVCAESGARRRTYRKACLRSGDAVGTDLSSRVVEAKESVACSRMVRSAGRDGGSHRGVVVDVGLRLLGKRVGLYHDPYRRRAECADADFADHGERRTLEADMNSEAAAGGGNAAATASDRFGSIRWLRLHPGTDSPLKSPVDRYRSCGRFSSPSRSTSEPVRFR